MGERVDHSILDVIRCNLQAIEGMGSKSLNPAILSARKTTHKRPIYSNAKIRALDFNCKESPELATNANTNSKPEEPCTKREPRAFLDELKANMEAIKKMEPRPKVMAPPSTTKSTLQNRKPFQVSSVVKKYNTTSKFSSERPQTQFPKVKKTLNFVEENRKRLTCIPRQSMLPKSDGIFKQPMTQPKRVKARPVANRISGIAAIPPSPLPIPMRASHNKENVPTNCRQIRQNLPAYGNILAMRDNLNASVANSELSFLQKEEELKGQEDAVLAASTPFRKYREVQNEVEDMTENYESTLSLSNNNERTVRTSDAVGLVESLGKQTDKALIRSVVACVESTLYQHKKTTYELEQLLNHLNDILERPENNDGDGEDVIVEKMTKFHIQYDQKDNRKSLQESRIPRRSTPRLSVGKKCLTRKVQHKSMPSSLNIVHETVERKSPMRPLGSQRKALSMYMQMKQSFNFLETPGKKRTTAEVSSPRLMSLNLMNQLEKLYD